MKPSERENHARRNQAPAAAELVAFADSQISLAGIKRTADEVSDLEVPEGSRPMLALESTRHRPNHPETNPQLPPSTNHSNQPKSSRDPQHTPSSDAIRSSSIENVTQPPAAAAAAAALPSASSRPGHPGSETAPSQLITPVSAVDRYRSSLIVQSMLREAFDKGQSQGRQAIQAELNETKANFQKASEVKDLGLYDQQMIITKYQNELAARRRRIQYLEQQITQQHGQNISSQQVRDAEARFSALKQELILARGQNNILTAELGTWKAQRDIMTADFEKWKAAFNTKASQLDACQRQRDNSARELQESEDRAKKLTATNSQVLGSLEGSVKTLTKVVAERSAEIKLIKALNEELRGNSRQVEDGKEEIDALTSENNKLAKARDELEKTVARQDQELEDLSAENEELTRKLQEREEVDERVASNPENTFDQADEYQVEETDDLLPQMAAETAADDVELARVMLEWERVRAEAEYARRETTITATLEEMEETERRRRQLLVDDLEDKNAQLYGAQKQIEELNRRLLAAPPSQSSESPSVAPSFSLPLPGALASPTTHSSPLIAASFTPSHSHARSWFRLSRPVPTFSLRRLLILLLIFLLAFISLYLHSPSSRPSATEDSYLGQVETEDLPWPADETSSASEVYEDSRRSIQAWAMVNWDRNELMFGSEEPLNVDEEDRPIPRETF